jgi:Flp pilus assembly protein TadD
MVWPADLAIFYPYPPALSLLLVGGAVALVVAVTALAWRLRASHPFLVAGWSWYLVTLVPVIGVIQVGSQARADRYTYVPLIGIFVAIAWGVPALVARLRLSRVVPAVAALSSILVLAAVARAQVAHWRDDVAVWRRAVEATAGSPQHGAQFALGTALLEAGRTAEAVGPFREAARLEPSKARYHSDLGAALLATDRPTEALAAFRAAVRAQPDQAETHFDLGVVLVLLGRREEAVEAFCEAVRLDPAASGPRQNLAATLMALGRRGEALVEYRALLRVDPGNAAARAAIGGG